jgi:hypothetical protein
MIIHIIKIKYLFCNYKNVTENTTKYKKRSNL